MLYLEAYYVIMVHQVPITIQNQFLSKTIFPQFLGIVIDELNAQIHQNLK